MTNTLVIHFAGNAVRFNVDHAALTAAIQTHFKHCLGTGENIVAEYQVRAGDDASLFSMMRDGEDFQSNITFEQVLFQLMQDGLTKLNGASKTHLIFHAAALAYRDRGLLLCGRSGSGKSTLAAWLTSGGYEYLTDEVVAYPLAGGEARGFCRSLALKKGSSVFWERWLPKDDSNAALKMEDGSVWIPPTLLNPSAAREQVEPHVILFPTYKAGAEFQTEELSLAGTVFMLMQSLVNARNFSDHGMAAVKELSQKVSAYRLTYSDIEQASAWIQQTIAK